MDWEWNEQRNYHRHHRHTIIRQRTQHDHTQRKRNECIEHEVPSWLQHAALSVHDNDNGVDDDDDDDRSNDEDDDQVR